MSLFDTTDENAENVIELNTENAERVTSRIPFAFSATETMLEALYRDSLNTEQRMSVVSAFQRDPDNEELIAILKNTYYGGRGFYEGDTAFSVWFDDDGIRIAGGRSARYEKHAQLIPWSDAVFDISDMLRGGRFASNVELAEAYGYEVKTAAEKLWYIHSDFSEDAGREYFSEPLWEGGFADSTARIAGLLSNADTREVLEKEFLRFVTDYESNRGLLRFHYHKPRELLTAIRNLGAPRVGFESTMTVLPEIHGFISDDEIDEVLRRYGNFGYFKCRLYDLVKTDTPTENLIRFLKNDYGIGGRMPALPGIDHSGEAHEGRGMTLTAPHCAEVQLPWNKIAERYRHMILSDRYFTPEESEKYRMLKQDNFPFHVGDKVYIRDEEYAIDTIDMYHVTLTNPNQPYPVGRVEDKVHLLELLQKDERNRAVLASEPTKTEYAPFVISDSDDSDDFDVDEEEVDTAIEPTEEPPQNTTFTTEVIAVYSTEETHLPYEVVLEKLHVNSIEPEKAEPIIETIPARNFRITDDALGVGGPKAKFRSNMDAVYTLKTIENENRNASLEEQTVLSRYVGWGGLADAFDEEKDNWKKEYAELKAALSDDEYAMARGSTLNAHYTSPVIIRGIYEAIANMGFKSGNILEPAMGIGNFFGLLPESMNGSRLYGVELDSVSGRIAQKLYPKANITVAGFETTDRRDFFDLAVGNVPFGNYQVNDKAYNKLGFSIHNYFFAKTIDQVRPGGVIAFITSHYTMDSKNSEVRRYIAERADLLGAIRLPSDAFLANAGAEVTSDILFLQKRDRPSVSFPDWLDVSENADGIPLNQYFIAHPEMVLGTMKLVSGRFGQDVTCEAFEGKDLADLLHEAVTRISGTYRETEITSLDDEEAEKEEETIPADPTVRNYSFTVVDGDIYYRQNSIMVKADLPASQADRVKGLIALRDCVRRLIEKQMDVTATDEDIRVIQGEMHVLYDRFTGDYGLINDSSNRRAFSDDSAYYLLCSLEILDRDGKLERLADMFTKRTIKPHEVVRQVDTAAEALAVSIGEKAKVDLPYMAELTGLSRKQIISDLRGVIFQNIDPNAPEDFYRNGFDWNTYSYVTADEYLSGNVRKKLRTAELLSELYPEHEEMKIAVDALRAAQPKDLEASEIEVRLGATWIDTDYINQFMQEIFELPYYVRSRVRVLYSDTTAEWQVQGKSLISSNNVMVYTTYGTEDVNGLKILEDSLNLRDTRVYDTVSNPDGTEKRVLNIKKTTLAGQKQQMLKDAFKEWIWKDPTRREYLVTFYNERFNSVRPREYDGSHIVFSGMNPEITLREHQKNAIAHVLYGGNTLLAHEVGAGKTFEMVGAAMEAKRLGLCNKSLFVVPNHLTEQWAGEFLRLYPSANILVATKKDFETARRKKFCARIATGDYDAVIIGHSQFEKIPISKERQEQNLQAQLDEIADGIAELKSERAERFTVKQLEKMKKSIEIKLEKLQSDERKDDVVTFEELGVDRLFVDECHNYKNLFLFTKMNNVAGLSTSDAQKSSDMYMKCRYMDELTGNRGVIFATGTPMSNSMTELYTMMRYLQHDSLEERRLSHFDCWASLFGETTTAIELAPEGTGYRARTRFAKFYNLPELMNLFKEAADIKTQDQLHLPRPTAVYHNEVAQPSEIQKGLVKELSERAALIHAGVVDPSVDNMLRITSDGRKLGLDERLINPDFPDEEGSKVNLCVQNIFRIWTDGKTDKLTQLLFCDLSTPKNDGIFNVYDDIRNKLVNLGIPKEEIAFIHEADTEVKKSQLFSKVRSGDVRILMGSTAKMGAGTNVQERLIALHDLDAPWRPGDLEQRSGRIIRQGNRNAEVHIYRYVTESTFDSYLWQTIENKQKFISQIMTSKSPVRSCEDVDEAVLSYAEIKALCAGNPMIKEKMDLDIEVSKLKMLKANHQSEQFRLEDNLLKHLPAEIESAKVRIEGFTADIATVSIHEHPQDGFIGMTVGGYQYDDRGKAGEAILKEFAYVKFLEPREIGTYRGFRMFLTLEDFGSDRIMTLKGKLSYRVELGKDARGNILRIDNALGLLPSKKEEAGKQLISLEENLENTKAAIGKPFEKEEELRQKSARLTELNAILNMDTAQQPEEEPPKKKNKTYEDLEV